MVDFDHFTIGRMHVRVDNLATGGRNDRGPGPRRKIDAFVETFLTAEGSMRHPKLDENQPSSIGR